MTGGGEVMVRRIGLVENRSYVPVLPRLLVKMMLTPSFDHVGIKSLFAPGMYAVCAPVVASMTKIPLPLIRSTAISLATGLHFGCVQPGGAQLANDTWPLPLAFITHTPGKPLLSLLWNAILDPSGDHDGEPEFFAEKVKRAIPVPSAFIVKILAPAPGTSAVNAIRVPSGE
jgi:hypothetical protein